MVFDRERRRVSVVIEDDGVGIAPRPEREHRHGMAIMDERARSLGGAIETLRRAQGGTRIALSFSPLSIAESGDAPAMRKQVNE